VTQLIFNDWYPFRSSSLSTRFEGVVDRSTLYRGIARGSFPKLIRYGHRTVRWKRSAILECLARLNREAQGDI